MAKTGSKKDKPKARSLVQPSIFESLRSGEQSKKDTKARIDAMVASRMFEDLDIPLSTYEKNVYDLWKVYQDNLACANSNSEECTSPDGYHFWIRLLKKDQIIINKVICPKHKAKLAKMKYLDRYLWRQFDPQFAGRFMSDANIDAQWDKSRIGFLRFLIDFFEKIKLGDESVKGFYLSGPSGVGKTYLVSLLCNSIANFKTAYRQKYDIAFLNFVELLNMFAEKFAERISVDHEVRKIIECDLLVFDDIGAETPRNWFFNNHFARILNQRSYANKLTIFISNHDLRQLKKHYLNSRAAELDGKTLDRILSRIHNLTAGNVFELAGKDFRMQKK